MSSRPELKLIQDAGQWAELRAEQRLEDYLDHLCAPLIGTVPYPDRYGLREEARAHLESLAAEYQAEGRPLHEAMEAALREFGEPSQIGQAFLEEWSQTAPPNKVARRVGAAGMRAFAFFGIATMLNLLLLEGYALDCLRPDLLPSLLLLMVVSPILAGMLTGWSAPARVVRGAYQALLVLILDSAVTSAVLLPHTEVAFFALCQLLFWLPVGCLSAQVTALFIRRQQRHHFWRLAR